MGDFELRKINKDERGEKCFVSMFSGMCFSGLIQIEKYVAIRKGINHFTLEVFTSNFDFTRIEGKRKHFYLGDDDGSSYYLLSFIPTNSEPEVKKMGAVVFLDEKSYLPLYLAYDLCPDQRSKKLIEAISKVDI